MVAYGMFNLMANLMVAYGMFNLMANLMVAYGKLILWCPKAYL